MNSTQDSTEPTNKDLENTETSNQETISSKNTEDFSGQISTDSGIELILGEFYYHTFIIFALLTSTDTGIKG